MIKILSFVFIFLAIVTPVFALPTLQLYIPDATYYQVNPFFPDSKDSWITTSNPFQLQVVGATSPAWVNYIDNLKLHIALLENEYLLYKNLANSFITIEDCDPNINFQIELYASHFSIWGQPQGVSPHGIYPTYYASVNLPDLLVSTAGEIVYDYNEDFDPEHPELSGIDSGDIQYYSVGYDPRFSFIHFDATGTAHNGITKDVFAPYSHDADAAVPEPASLLLLSIGFLGLEAFGKRRRKRA